MNDPWIMVKVNGVVQGVGFRPAVYRVAVEQGLAGTVENAVDGVHIALRGGLAEASRLIEGVRMALPPVARIDDVTFSPITCPQGVDASRFTIVHSTVAPGKVTDVSPDIAICPDCLADIERQPRRRGYMLTNCTNCGPRFTIIRSLPYDRPATSMSPFEMCGECKREYTDPLDRRFHAQPVSCNDCGPRYTMMAGDDVITDMSDIIARSRESLDRGEILMVKSLGGYNLMANALDGSVIERLRQLKHRPRKPFAVMVADMDAADRLVKLTDPERDALASWRAPIVVATLSEGVSLPATLAPRCTTLGVMLPYMALQHHLLRQLPYPVIVTSANLPGEPIMTDDAVARQYARSNHLPLVAFNREIVNRVDDSVVRLCGGAMRILRRSRGYVPEAIGCHTECEGIVAMGADITSTWALGRGSDIIQSQYIGRLTGEGAERFLRSSLESLTALYRCTPRVIVTDAHPSYRSAAIGEELARHYGVPCMKVWHHHAHAAGVMTEYGLRGPVLALVLDGTGYGTDGTIWGSELLRCTLTSFERIDHGPALAMPGGDKASLEPWRMAVAFVHAFCGDLSMLPPHIPQAVGEASVTMIERMIDRHINSPLSCGAGRMWDAVAALLGLALTNGYESEAPILLENLAMTHDPDRETDFHATTFDELAHSLLSAIRDGKPACDIAYAFHSAYADCWSAVIGRHLADMSAKGDSPAEIVLSGGVMQNALLCDMLRDRLQRLGLTVYIPRRIPCGDAGVAAGQIAIAAARLSEPSDSASSATSPDYHLINH